MRSHILVTGVSSGIGYACTEYFIEKGYHVFGSVRKESDGLRLKEEMGELFTPLLFDLTDAGGIETAFQQVRAQLTPDENLFALVANAGIQIPGPLLHLNREDMHHQFGVNVFGTLHVIQLFIPLLKASSKNKPGRILHVGSTSAAIVLPFTALYSGAKSAMHSICDSLQEDLRPSGIDVIDIYVGPVKNDMVNKVAPLRHRYKDTEYFHSMSLRLDNALTNNIPNGLSERQIAVSILRTLETPKPRHRFALNKDWWNTWALPRLLPARWLDKIIARKWKMRPGDFEG